MRATRGFTLIEIMIVVAIIGMLTTIAVPRFQGFQARARRTEAVVNLSALGNTLHAYHGENGTMTCDLVELGWYPEGSPRFVYGFRSGGADCPAGSISDSRRLATVRNFDVSNMKRSNGVPLTESDLNFTVLFCINGPGIPPCSGVDGDWNSFIVSAQGNVDNDAYLDTIWYMSRGWVNTLWGPMNLEPYKIGSGMALVRDDTDDSHSPQVHVTFPP